ncbi:PREDICTED: MLO-like protein 4 [Nelumbo nucifera]|uniref:MLO-like protein 4 n=1 Tax=Nelumbo nucifera TaxID=4432 RepID=A0A1U7YXD0_NELNU|nr:PREDICTED: MLO-like protein 4 [Nelumbo nucifera]
MKNHDMIITRLASGLVVQFWCSYNTVPLNVIITQMGSKFKRALIAERVRESLHSWCKRVKEKSKHDSLHSRPGTARSTCSLESAIDERDEITVASGTLSRCSSAASLNQLTITSVDELPITSADEIVFNSSDEPQYDQSFRASNHSSRFRSNELSQPPSYGIDDISSQELGKVYTLLELFRKT